MTNRPVTIDADSVEMLLEEKLPGAEVSRRELLGVETIAARVWQFTLEARIEGNAAQLRLMQQPRKDIRHALTVRKRTTLDFREVHAFVTDAILTLAGIAAAILVGIEGEDTDLEFEFKGSDDLIWDAIKEETKDAGGD